MLLDSYSLKFGDVNSADYGIYIFGGGIYNKPRRRVTKYTVPGRSGDLTIDEGAYDNVEVTYQAIVTDDFGDRFNGFMTAMYRQNGYQRLTDSFDKEHFRQALFCEAVNPIPGVNGEYGKFELKFDSKPQRWLKTGDEWIEIDPTRTQLRHLDNPTKEKAYPLVYCTGNGTFELFNDQPYLYTYFTLASVVSSDVVAVDCELEEAYYAVAYSQMSANDKMTSGNQFPFLGTTPGVRASGFSAVKMKCRWWEI